MQNSLDLSTEDFDYFRRQVLQLSGIHLADNKRDFFRSRLMARLEALDLPNLQAYRSYLASLPPNDGEWQEFINQVTTNKTEFFREPAHYRMLLEKFLPQWKGLRLRVWSAACARGEEAYTLAMVLYRFFKDSSRFEIVASDIDTTVLAHAVNGVYPLQRLHEIPVEYHYQSIIKGKGEVKDWFKIRDELKKTIKFRHFNLVRDAFDFREPFDIVFCRNVFLYFQPETIDTICDKFNKIMSPDGLLVLGHSESLGPQNTAWKPTGPSVYRKMQAKNQLVTHVEEKKTAPTTRKNARKKLLIVDDSATMRQLLSQSFSKSDQLTVVGSVGDPRDVAEAVRTLNPDVITLDLKMPHMSGCEVLERVLADYAIPTLIISAVTMEEGPEVLRALELGAVDYIEKPTFESLKQGDSNLVDRVIQAAATKVRKGTKRTTQVPRLVEPRKSTPYHYQSPLLLVGASTGGIQALTEIFTQMPESIPPTLIVQHIPAVFSKAFATRLNQICPFQVKEAEHGDAVLPDQVLIAPGNRHMIIEVDGLNGLNGLKVSLLDTAPVNRHRPSVDVLFESAAKAGLGPQVIGVILTGMGNDGAAGLKLLKQHGARTIAQDEASCAVFGMPREAIRLNAAEVVCSLEKIPRTIERLLTSKPSKSA